MKKFTLLLLTAILGVAFMLAACSDSGKKNEGKDDVSLWNFNELSATVPKMEDAGYNYAGNENIKGMYFDGAEYNGKATKVFAFAGVPETEKPANGYPAMILVHGGLGQAFGDWVKLWTDRGYVAIALSIDANVTDSANKASANPDGGPNISLTPADMTNPANSWEYISVANIIMCNNLLRSMDNVDKNNIGITGISWGSYLTCITVGVDNRLKFAIPVYGAGYNHEDVTSSIASAFSFDDAAMDIYSKRFDPAVYVAKSDLPIFWLAGANDHAFSLACNQKSADGNKGDNTYSWHGRLTHGQQPGDGSGVSGENGLPEIFLYADRMTKGTDEMLRVSEGVAENGVVTVKTQNGVAVDSAHFYWSQFPVEFWHDPANVWEREVVSVVGDTLTVEIPEGAIYGFMEIIDTNGKIVSSRLFSF